MVSKVKLYFLLSAIVLMLTECDPVESLCKIYNNTDDVYIYTPNTLEIIRTFPDAKKLFTDYRRINPGDTSKMFTPKYFWASLNPNDTVGLFFLKENDLKNYPFDTILAQHMYIEKRLTISDVEKMKYFVKIVVNDSVRLKPS
jgi:hypothetical protein